MNRNAEVTRKTKETDISLKLSIDGTGTSSVSTGNGFMDHMLTLFSRHGLLDLDLRCAGDLEVDFHHSAEDIGICLGQAFDKALEDRRGITRYAAVFVPMDESLARVVLDISGRSDLVYHVPLEDRTISSFECTLVEDFFKAFTDNARMTLHVDLLRGRNSHHSIEAVFKAFGRVLRAACAMDARNGDSVPSTKGVL